MTKKDLDLIVLNIEFLLISVVQGVALSSLAGSAIVPITTFQWEYWPAIAAGFLLILIFWSQSVMHSLSFVDWPIELSHSFLYFLASFVQVVAFSQLTNPAKWFGAMGVFFVVIWLLYTVDLRLIRERADGMLRNPKKKKLYEHLLLRQTRERDRVVPFGIGFNLLCCVFIVFFPDVSLLHHGHVVLGLLQCTIFGFALYTSSVSYRVRTGLISAGMEQ